MVRKPLDLSQRQPLPLPYTPIPSFSPQHQTVGAVTAAGTDDIFWPKVACTVRWITIQTAAACTIQLLENGVPIGLPLALTAPAIVRLPGKILVNNAKLSLSVSVPNTVTFEVIWIAGFNLALVSTTFSVTQQGTAASGAATLAAQVAANFPQVVDLGDSGAHAAAAFVGATQTVPKGARNFVVTIITGASTATWQPLLNISVDGGVTWLRTHPVPTSATASSVFAAWSWSVPGASFSTNFGPAGATLQFIGNVVLPPPPLWHIEYTNSGATGFNITSSKVFYGG